MKEQTALQELIEQAKTGQEFSKDGFVTWEEVIEAATELLTKERAQIEKAVDSVDLEYRIYMNGGEYEPDNIGKEVPIREPNEYIGLTITGAAYFTTTYKQPL